MKKPHFIKINTIQDACNAYPLTVYEIERRTAWAIDYLQEMVDWFVSFEKNGCKKSDIFEFDYRLGRIDSLLEMFNLILHVHPDKAVRDKAHEKFLYLENEVRVLISFNNRIYKILKKYVSDTHNKDQHTPNEWYALTRNIESFERDGIHLPQKKRDVIQALKKRDVETSQIFSKNIADDTTSIVVLPVDLTGVPQSFIDELEKTDDGSVILRTDYPTIQMILSECSNRHVREKLWKAFGNRAYPQNMKVLDDLIALRDQIAQMLGFSSFSAYDVDDQMVKTTQRARTFIKELEKDAREKAWSEVREMIAYFDDTIVLSDDKKLYGWDIGYLTNQYKKARFNVDELEIAQYFSLDKTIDGLFAIYERFFGLTFKEEKIEPMWHDDVRAIGVYDEGGTRLRGYVFLDLYPRLNKYSHAAQFGGISTVTRHDGSICPAVVTVVCNFTKPTNSLPSLLRYSEVSTFFHEFGHALHTILGSTTLYVPSGTATTRDFVELPSQILEYWLEDYQILKMVSSHYKTGKPLPDDLIKNKIASLNWGEGMFLSRQLSLSLLALNYYEAGEKKETDAIKQRLFEQFCPYIVSSHDTHMQCSFGHLTGYGAKYYGYMWSKVFAADIFDEIEKEGLLNPVAGKRYASAILCPGGTVDPNQMLANYLGRTPRQDAFLARLQGKRQSSVSFCNEKESARVES